MPGCTKLTRAKRPTQATGGSRAFKSEGGVYVRA
jgi:hypothetical protein